MLRSPPRIWQTVRFYMPGSRRAPRREKRSPPSTAVSADRRSRSDTAINPFRLLITTPRKSHDKEGSPFSQHILLSIPAFHPERYVHQPFRLHLKYGSSFRREERRHFRAPRILSCHGLTHAVMKTDLEFFSLYEKAVRSPYFFFLSLPSFTHIYASYLYTFPLICAALPLRLFRIFSIMKSAAKRLRSLPVPAAP